MIVVNKITGEEKDIGEECGIIPDHPSHKSSEGMRLYLVNYGQSDVWFSAYSKTKPQEYEHVVETKMVMYHGYLIPEDKVISGVSDSEALH